MILQALCELAEAEQLLGDPDYEYKPVSWVVRLREDGSLVNIEDYRRNINEGRTTKSGKPLKAKWQGKNELVPTQPPRTSGDKAFFLVDKPEYVFGSDPNGKRSTKKLQTRAQLFREDVERCATETEDADVRAVAAFLQSITVDPSIISLPQETSAGDLFAFKVGESSFVHLRPSVKSWWKNRRAMTAEEPRHRCLISGEPVAEVELFPLIKGLPGGTPSGVALVSHNARAFESYGLRGNDNAPVSRIASQSAALALNRLLHREPDKAFGRPELKPRQIRLNADTVAVYWSPYGDPAAMDAIIGLTEAESADAVADVYRSIWRGDPPTLNDPSRFYAMTITGTQGRAVVRDWFEATVADVMDNLARHFANLGIVRNTRAAKGATLAPFIPLRHMLEALAAPGRDAQIPATLASEIFRAALRGTTYPVSILQRALVRERSEAGGDDWIDSVRRDARAALIKAVLVRHFQMEVEYEMNYEEKNSGYLIGRLLAVLEDMQRQALGHRNATIVDKYYGAASATPAAVFPTLMDLCRKHARKAKESRPGAVVNREKEIDAILVGLDYIPRHFDLVDQGMFVLGYHHQRRAIMDKQWSFEQPEEEPAEPPETADELEFAQ